MSLNPIKLFNNLPYLDGFLFFACKSLPDPSRVAVIVSSKEIAEGRGDCKERVHLMYESLIIQGKYNVYHVISADGDIDKSLSEIPLGDRKIQLLIIAACGGAGIIFERGYLTAEKIERLALAQLNPEGAIVLDICKSSEVLAPSFKRRMPYANILSSEIFHNGGLYACRPPPETHIYCDFYNASEPRMLREVVITTGLVDIDERIKHLRHLMFLNCCRGDRAPGISELFKTFSPQAVAYLTVNFIKDHPDYFQYSTEVKEILDDVIFILKNEADCFAPFMDQIRDLASSGNVLGQVLLYFTNPDTTDIPDENPLKFVAFGIRQYKIFDNLTTALECFSRSKYLYAKEYINEIVKKHNHPRAIFLKYLDTGLPSYLEEAASLKYPEAIALQKEKLITDLGFDPFSDEEAEC